MRGFTLLLVFFVALLSGCGGESATVAASKESVSPLERGTFTRDLLLTGELEAVNSIEIKAPQTSIFQMRIQFMAEEGTRVEVGDPLLDFDNSALATQALELETQILDAETQIIARESQLASSLKDLEIELEEKRFNYERTRLDAGIDPEIVSQKEFAERTLAFTQADRELRETVARVDLTRDRGVADLDVLRINRDKLRKDLLQAKGELGLLSIQAPAAGLVVYSKRDRSTLKYQEGDSCWPGQGVLSLPDLVQMRAVFDVNEVDAPSLRVDDELEIRLDAFPERPLLGKIELIPSMAVKRDEASRIAVFKVRANLSQTWIGEMKPGMSILGRLQLEGVEDTPLVRRDAVRIEDGRFWLEAEGRRQEIHPLARNATHYRIEEDAWAALGGEESS
jgi:multidrug efflux pump subunit AcrA (membrane-fusion protein)